MTIILITVVFLAVTKWLWTETTDDSLELVSPSNREVIISR